MTPEHRLLFALKYGIPVNSGKLDLVWSHTLPFDVVLNTYNEICGVDPANPVPEIDTLIIFLYLRDIEKVQECLYRELIKYHEEQGD